MPDQNVIRIAITGVESTGKTTLAKALSAALGGVFVPECARFDAEVRAGNVSLATLSRLANEQLSACRLAASQAKRDDAACVVSDTDATVLKLWGKQVYGREPEGLDELIDWPQLTLLCAPNIPWEADPLRTLPKLEDRMNLHAKYERALASMPHVAAIDALAHEKRLDQAVRAFQNFLG